MRLLGRVFAAMAMVVTLTAPGAAADSWRDAGHEDTWIAPPPPAPEDDEEPYVESVRLEMMPAPPTELLPAQREVRP